MTAKIRWEKFEELANIFFHSNWFILLMAFFTLCGWVASIWVEGIWVYFLLTMIVLTIFMFCTCPDSTPLFVFLFFMLPTANMAVLEEFSRYAWMIIPCILLILSMIFNIIRFKPNFREIICLKKMRKTTFSMFLIVIPMCLGGLFKTGRDAGWAVIYVVLFVTLSFGFIYFMAVSKTHVADKEKFLPYIIKLMVASGIIVSVEMLIFYVGLGNLDAISHCIFTKGLFLGWATANPAAGALILYMPANLYFVLKKNKFAFLFVLLTFLEFLLMVSASSRGALLFGAIGLPIITIYAFVKSENKKQLVITLGALMAAGVLILILSYNTFFYTIIDRLRNMGADDNGRFDIYLYGLQVFKDHPVFGAGWDFGIGQQHVSYSPYLFHSTIIQILACSGIVGFLGYAYYYYARYRSFFIKKNVAGYIVLAGMWIFEAYAMIDPIFFIPPTFFIQLLIMSFAMENSVDDLSSLAFKEGLLRKLHKQR